MKLDKKNKLNMNYKTIKVKKGEYKLFSSSLKFICSPQQYKRGLIYTLYSEKSNKIKIGYASNDRVLETIVLSDEFVLLDKKYEKKEKLNLVIKTLNELNIKSLGNLSFTYSNKLIRNLSTLGWPIGGSIYKQRKIKKEFSFA